MTTHVLDRAAPCLLILSLALLVGCGSGGDMGTVSGQVTMDGQPLADAQIAFYPADGRPAQGTTDAEGRYTLQYTPDQPGAPVGTHTVRITVAQVSGEGQARVKETVPPRYNVQSELTAEVKPGKNDNVDFDLTSK